MLRRSWYLTLMGVEVLKQLIALLKNGNFKDNSLKMTHRITVLTS